MSDTAAPQALTWDRLIRIAVQAALSAPAEPECPDCDEAGPEPGLVSQGLGIWDTCLNRHHTDAAAEARALERVRTLLAADLMPAERAALLALIERIENVVGYVTATVSRGNTFAHDFKGCDDPNNWRLAHAGRLAASERLLSALLDEARALPWLKRGDGP